MTTADWLQRFVGGKDSLRRKTLSGTQWLMLKSVVLGLLELGRSMLFMRLLSAYDFGVMALAVILPGFVHALTITNTDVMIQREGEDYEVRLPHYWTLNVIRGVVDVLIIWWLSGVFAGFYGNAALVWPIRALALPLFFLSIGGFGVPVRQRRMDFKAPALYTIAAEALAVAVSVVIVLVVRNYWAVVFHQILLAAAAFVCSFLLFPWRPRFAFSAVVARAVAVFAISAILLNAFNYFHMSFDRMVLAGYFALDDVGRYSRAYFLALLPAQFIGVVVPQVLLPAFRTIAHDGLRLRLAFFKASAVLSAGYAIIGAVMFAAARPFVLVVAGEKWLSIIPLFRILLVYGVSKNIAVLASPIFYLYKKPMRLSFCAGIMAAVFAALCIPMTRGFGMNGMAWAVVLSGAGSHVVALVLAFRLLVRGPPLAD